MKLITLAEKLQSQNKFSLRTCWQCNPAHEHLKKSKQLMMCIGCMRWYMYGDFFDNEKHCNKKICDACNGQGGFSGYSESDFNICQKCLGIGVLAE